MSNKIKAALVEEELSRNMVFIQLDSRTKGTVLPDELKDKPCVPLNFSRNFAPPDVGVSELGISQTLTFRGEYFKCFVPWGAVFYVRGVESGREVLFPESAPPEIIKFKNTVAGILNDLVRETGKEVDLDKLISMTAERIPNSPMASPPLKSGLRLIKGGRED